MLQQRLPLGTGGLSPQEVIWFRSGRAAPGCIQQITGGLTWPQLYKASRQEVRTTGRRQVGRPQPTTQPGTLGGKGPSRERETEEESSLTLGGGNRACVPHGRAARRRGFTEPMLAELRLELSLMTLSPVLSLHGPRASSSGEDRERRFPAHVSFVSKWPVLTISDE